MPLARKSKRFHAFIFAMLGVGIGSNDARAEHPYYPSQGAAYSACRTDLLAARPLSSPSPLYGYECNVTYGSDYGCERRVGGNYRSCKMILNQSGGWRYIYPAAAPIDEGKNDGKPECCGVGNPINAATGAKFQSILDIVDVGLLSFTRYYGSSSRRNDIGLGPRWTHSFSRSISHAGDTAQLIRDDKKTFQFTFDSVDGVWRSQTDVTYRLRSISGEGWSVITPQGDIETYDTNGKLLELRTQRGDSALLSYSDGVLQSVDDRSGRSLTFAYDGGRIQSVTAADGFAATYTYDPTDGNLRSVTYVKIGAPSSTVEYLYEDANFPHQLTGIIDEASNRYASWSYDEQGRAFLSVHGDVNSEVDRHQIAYGEAGSADPTITDPLGHSSVRSFMADQGQWKVLGAIDGHPDEVFRLYDALGYLASTTDRFDIVTEFVHDPNGLLLQRTDAANDTAGHKRTTQTDWDVELRQPMERRTYNALSVLVTKSNWTYNTRGQALTQSQTDPSTSTTRTITTTYCEQTDIDAGTCPLLGLVTKIDGPRTDVGDITTYTYYASDDPSCTSAPTICPHRKGDLWKVTNALNQVTETLRYDGAGRVLSVKAPTGVVTDMEYHPRGWLTARMVRGANDSSETDDAITRIEYWPTGLVKQVTQPDGAFTAYVYDDAHRLTDIVDGEGNTIHYTLDNAGNRTGEDTKDAQGTLLRTLSRVYNQLGQLETQWDAYDHDTGYTYDASGNSDKVTDALGRVTDNDYDPLNRLRRTLQDVDGIAAETKFEYDALDNLTKVTDPKGLDTDYTYNGFGDLLQLDSPDTGTTTYTYDSAGNRHTQTDARGITTTYSHDALNRLTAISYSDGSPGVTYTYDGWGTCGFFPTLYNRGRLSAMSDASGLTTFCHDRFGNLTQKLSSINGKAFRVSYAYTMAGQLSHVIYPDGMAVDYVRDAQGRILEVGVTTSGGTRQVLLYDAIYYPFGPAAQWTYGNGRLMRRSLNQNYQPGFIEDASDDGISLGYEFDEVGNLRKLRGADQADPPLRLFNYDGLNRLTETRDGTTTALLQGYDYDATGNRTSATDDGSTTLYTYSSTSHHLSDVGGVARNYDNAGNTTAIGGAAKEFIYNAANRMNQVKADSTVKMNYVYNGKGEQARKYLGASSTYTVYDEAGHWLGDYTGSGAIIQQAVWLDDLPVGLVIKNGQLHYVEPDHVGTPRVVIDPGRDMAVWSWDLAGEAFGDSAPDEDPDGNGANFNFDLRYPGQKADSASGLNYNYMRDGYQPTVGRYSQSDPIGLKGGVSTYSYVEGRPFRYTDPWGLFSWDASCDECGGNNMNQDWKRQLQAETDTACQRVDQMITNIRRAKCIKQKCDRAKVGCGKCSTSAGPDGTPVVGEAEGRQSWLMWPERITICTNSPNHGPQPSGYGAVVLIHEFAHTCGWDDLGGDGVPDPWAEGATYASEANRWGF